jgi:hypothetical protein
VFGPSHLALVSSFMFFPLFLPLFYLENIGPHLVTPVKRGYIVIIILRSHLNMYFPFTSWEIVGLLPLPDPFGF